VSAKDPPVNDPKVAPASNMLTTHPTGEINNNVKQNNKNYYAESNLNLI